MLDEIAGQMPLGCHLTAVELERLLKPVEQCVTRWLPLSDYDSLDEADTSTYGYDTAPPVLEAAVDSMISQLRKLAAFEWYRQRASDESVSASRAASRTASRDSSPARVPRLHVVGESDRKSEAAHVDVEHTANCVANRGARDGHVGATANEAVQDDANVNTKENIREDVNGSNNDDACGDKGPGHDIGTVCYKSEIGKECFVWMFAGCALQRVCNIFGSFRRGVEHIHHVWGPTGSGRSS